MSAPEWWEGMAALDVEGPEGAGGHRIVWRDGCLELGSHPDPEAELAVVALGGERCPCLDVLEAWDDCHRSGAMLVAGRRHGSEALVAPVEATRRLRDDLRHWRRSVALLTGEARAAGDVALLERLAALVDPVERRAARRLGFLLLLGLDPRLSDRLQASVAATIAASGRSATLAAAAAARALPALRSIGWAGAAGDITLGPEPVIETDSVVLPPAWLAVVWGRGIEGVVPGHLVLDVVGVKPDGSLDVVAGAIGKGSFARSVDEWENAIPHTSPGAT